MNPQIRVQKTKTPRDEQAAKLNTYVKCRVAPSPIHGVGVIAIRDIEKGQRLYADVIPEVFDLPYSSFSHLFPVVKQLLLERFPLVTKGSLFVYPDTRLQAYINHSDTPNYDPVKDVLLVDLKEGEEVTEDYRLIEGWEIAHPWLAKK